MKKTILCALALLLFSSLSLIAQDTAANDAYIQAMTANDIQERARLLKDWTTKYGGNGHPYENFAYATLCTLPYNGKTQDEIIKYGEKALALGELDESTKCQVLISVANSYVYKGQSLDKAKKYAEQVIQIAKTAKGEQSSTTDSSAWSKLIGAGYFLQAQAMEKAGDLEDAVTAYINSYSILKNKQIIASVGNLGKTLYDKKKYGPAEKALKLSASSLKDFGSITLYAKTLHRLGKKSEALDYYKQSYAKKKTGEIAYNIGLLLASEAKTSPDKSSEAIQYLLNASFLSPANSEKAMKLAEGLYFSHHPEYNEKVQALQAKSKNLENLTTAFNDKFKDKDEEDLSESEKKEMESLLTQIEAMQKEIAQLQKEQQLALDKFQNLITQIKKELTSD